MNRCRACGVDILWVEKPQGGYFRPMVVVEKSPGIVLTAVINEQSVEIPLFLQIHECDPQLKAELDFRQASYDAAVRSIDCPHPRCNGVVGGPCISLKDGETPLASHHNERIRAVPRERFPKPYGGKL